MKLSFLLQVFATIILSCHGMAPLNRPASLSITRIPRGGFGPIKPQAAAKICGTAYFLQGSQLYLAPTLVKPYTDAEVNECNANLIRNIGLTMMNLGINVYCLIHKKFGLKTTAAINCLLWVGDCISSLLNNKSETIGPSKLGDGIIATIGAAVAISGLEDLPWFDTAYKVDAAFVGICALPLLLMPGKGKDLWELKGDDDMTPGLCSLVGLNLLELGVFMGCISRGLDPINGIGYACAATTLAELKHYLWLSQNDKEGKGNKVMCLVWGAFEAALAASILL